MTDVIPWCGPPTLTLPRWVRVLVALLRRDGPGYGGSRGGPEDVDLVSRVVSRDADALAALYDRHRGLLFALAVRILGDRADAEEVLLDVFWEFWERPDRYDPSRGAPRAYLTILTRSRATDRLRLGERRRRVLDESGDALERSLHGRGAASSPAIAAEDAQLRDCVRAALERLHPHERTAIELSFYESLSHSEIAERLGTPLGTVKTRIRQGMIRMRESVAEFHGTGRRA